MWDVKYIRDAPLYFKAISLCRKLTCIQAPLPFIDYRAVVRGGGGGGGGGGGTDHIPNQFHHTWHYWVIIMPVYGDNCSEYVSYPPSNYSSDYSPHAHVQCSTGSKDYGAISEVRVFTVGSVAGQSICVSVSTYYDHLVEYTEYFGITLTTNSPNATIGDRAGGVAFIVYVEDINGEAALQ